MALTIVQQPTAANAKAAKAITINGVEKYGSISEFCYTFKQNDTYYFYQKNKKGRTDEEIEAIMKERYDAGKWAPKYKNSSKPKSTKPEQPASTTRSKTLTAEDLRDLATAMAITEQLTGVPQKVKVTFHG